MSNTDLQSHLRRQFSFLTESCNSYDKGFKDEAIRLATVIRVLIHNTKNSTSLLKHLNATAINLLSTTNGATQDTVMYFGLGTMKLSGVDSEYFPSLDFGPIKTMIPVNEWWNQIVFVLDAQTKLSRKDIILDAANRDGGAHVDLNLSTEYQALAADGAIGSFVYAEKNGGNVTKPITQAHFVAIRQMAYELLNSPELGALLRKIV